MPIGASKVGALGGLVPGGSVTFNASGTWDVPPGVKVVSVTGKGGTGNPGNAGNQGNPGNPGSGGSGGGSGANFLGTFPCWSLQPNGDPQQNRSGGTIFKGGFPIANPYEPVCLSIRKRGGALGNSNPGSGNAGQAGQAGFTGNAGTAGNPGNPGNTGCSSSALGNTFPGGAGGNAGPGGAAGNAGGAGPAGNGGTGGIRCSNNVNTAPGGTGSCGGGNGGAGRSAGPLPQAPSPFVSMFMLPGKGGGGAGATNPGQSGQPGTIVALPNSYQVARQSYTLGGTTSSASAPFPNRINCPGNIYITCPVNNPAITGPLNTTGGFAWEIGSSNFGNTHAVTLGPWSSPSTLNTRLNAPAWSGPCVPAVFRSGSGGGSAGYYFKHPSGTNNPQYNGKQQWVTAGGGGGGGRGGAGNASGPTPTPSGTVATPATYNCVPVTPGTPTPVTVAAPGGTITISWNPQ